MTWTTYLHAVVTRPDQATVLTQAQQLPAVTGTMWEAEFDKISAAYRALLGVDVWTIRLLERNLDYDKKIQTAVVELCIPANANAASGTWQTLASLQTVPLANAHHQQLTWQVLTQTIVDPTLAPWSHYAWYANAANWIVTTLANTGYTNIQSPTQQKTWAVGCLLSTETDQGRVWFKATRTLPYFVNEPAVTTYLAGLFPDDIVAPIAVDIERNWLLTPHVGDDLNRPPTATSNGDAYRQMARIQKQSAAHVTSFEANGCLNRRLSWLSAQIEPMLNRIEQNNPELLNLVTRAKAHVTDWQQRIVQMQALPFPETLIHGDFHVGNVFGSAAPYTIIDWTDASISCPLIDLQAVLFFAKEEKWADYLTAWFDEWGIANWQPIVTLAQPIIGLFHLLSFEQIMQNVAPIEAKVYSGDLKWYLEQITP